MSLNNFLENKCEDKLNSKFIELEQKFEYKLNSKLLWLELKYEEKIEELEEKYEEKINNKLMELEQKYEEKFNNKLMELEQKYEEEIDELEGKYEEKIEELEGKYEELEEKYEEKIEELKEQYEEKNNIKLIELEKKYEHKLKDLQQMLNSKMNDISLNRSQKNDLDEGKLELKLMVLEQNYENRFNTKINDIKNNMVTQGDLDDMSFHCAQINPIAQVTPIHSQFPYCNSHRLIHLYNTCVFTKCANCVYNLYDNNNLCQYCRPHMINISGIRKLKKKNHLLISQSASAEAGYVNVIRINKNYYWLDLEKFLLFNYVPISALEFHRNIQGIDVIVRQNNNSYAHEKQYEYEKIIDNPASCGYFGFGPGTTALPVFYEVGRIDKLTKKVTFHNYN
jgi:hypothetical protein